MKKIYLFERDDGLVKIGCSKDVIKRKRYISTQGSIQIVRSYETEFCSNPFEIEKIMHKKYESNRIKGEWFRINFDDCVIELMKIFSENAKFEEKIFDMDKFEKTINYILHIDEYSKEECLQHVNIPHIPYWHGKNEEKIFEILKIKSWSIDDFYDEILAICCLEYDMSEALNIFKKEQGRYPHYTPELIHYFPEIEKFADELLYEFLSK